ncbi:MAG: hypothetical protein AB8W37_04045 [Arsenophonus endosymbiont of Dermacentor nuttalli]
MRHKSPAMLSLSMVDFNLLVHDEQIRLLCGLLTEEGYPITQPSDVLQPVSW